MVFPFFPARKHKEFNQENIDFLFLMGSKTSFTGCFYSGLKAFSLFFVSVKKAMQKPDTERKQTPIKKIQVFFILEHISVLLHTNAEREYCHADGQSEREKKE